MVGKAFEKKGGVQSQELCVPAIADFLKIGGLRDGWLTRTSTLAEQYAPATSWTLPAILH